MINKKMLILVILFSVILENVHAVYANNRQMQERTAVVEIFGFEFSKYNPRDESIYIDGVKQQLSSSFEDMSMGEYLRVRCMIEASELGMYDYVLNKKIPNAIQRKIGCFFSGMTWGDFAVAHNSFISLADDLYPTQRLDEQLIILCEQSRRVYEKIPASRREFFLWTAEIDYLPYKYSKLLIDPILDNNLPQYFSRAVYFKECNIKWKEYFCQQYPMRAIYQGLFTPEFLAEIVPDAIAEYENFPNGLNWMDFMYRCFEKHPLIIASGPKEFLNKKLPQQCVDFSKGKYAGLTMRKCLDLLNIH